MCRGIAGLLFCGIAFLSLGAAARATVETNASPAPLATPKESVARISVIDSGTVVLEHGDSKKQVTAAVNAPVVPGDFLSTAAGTQAELQFDGLTVLRLDGGVQARLVADDAKARTVQLADGTVEISILGKQSGATSIDTPSVTIRASEPGDYRVSIAADGSTSATARTGNAELVTPQKTYDLEPGKTLIASGAAANPSVVAKKESDYDSFDDFNAKRDKVLYAAIEHGSNLPPSIAGYDDLDTYGTWHSVAPYGWVWSPAGVAADWAPYRNGQWTWVSGYGWTWVSNEAWGWVPYHYGRWFYSASYGWCWYPPAVTVVPDWQPALVVFFGFGTNSVWGDSSGWGNVGWVPLAPYDSFYPWSGHGYSSLPAPVVAPTPPPRRRPPFPPPPPKVKPKPPVHPTRPLNEYRNAVAGGATFVTAQAFHDADFTHVAAVDVRRVPNVMPIHGAPPVHPGPQNLGFVRAPVATPVSFKPVFSEPRFAPVQAAHSPVRETVAEPDAERIPVTTITHESYPSAGVTPSMPARGSPITSAPVTVSHPSTPTHVSTPSVPTSTSSTHEASHPSHPPG